MKSGMTPNLEHAMYRAIEYVRQHQHTTLSIEHLLLGLMDDPDCRGIFKNRHVDEDALRDDIEQNLNAFPSRNVPYKRDENTQYDHALKMFFVDLQLQAKKHNVGDVTSIVCMAAMFSQNGSVAAQLLRAHGLVKEDFLRQKSSPAAVTKSANKVNKVDDVEDKDAAEKMAALQDYTVNLNEKAQWDEIDPVIGRKDEINSVIEILSRRTKNNPLLLGDPGVGKTAIAEGLAHKIVSEDVPERFLGKVIYSLNVTALMAGTMYRGDIEKRMNNLLSALESDPNAILFVDEIHMLLGHGLGNMLKPALARGDLHCIGATTYDEYRKNFERDPAFGRRFHTVDVPEPTEAETLQILKGLKKHYEDFHDVSYSDASLRAAVDLSVRHIRGKRLPDKAIDLLDRAGAYRVLVPERKGSIRVSEVEDALSRLTHMPRENLRGDDANKLERLDEDLRKAVFQQDRAVNALTSAVFLSHARQGVRNKPIGSYLFSGPTGVGKTELTKQLSKTLDLPLLRFDMSEYAEKHNVARLIGSPPGYVGFEEGGALTNEVEKHGHCIVLMDEIEKAHPDVYTILLQVMDDGRLTDGQGKTVDFSKVILIMTTNAGAQDAEVRRSIGFNTDDTAEKAEEMDSAVKRLFSPEFRNRLTAQIPFDYLKPETMPHIVEKFLNEMYKMYTPRKVTINVSDAAKSYLAEKGYDRLMGARPLSRLIQNEIEVPLSRPILFGEIKNGGTATIDVVNTDGKSSLSATFSRAVARKNANDNEKANEKTVVNTKRKHNAPDLKNG